MRMYRLFVSIALVGLALIRPADGAPPRNPDTKSHKATGTRLNEGVRPTQDPVTSPRDTEAYSNYVIDWYSLNGGGDINSTSPNNRLGASVGQSVVGEAQSTNYQVGIGFWYGGGCDCDCHGDPNCDGIIADVVDVVQVINVAFRGASGLADPNPMCPRERTDVGGGALPSDCDGVTNVVDVVKIINVAFRGEDPSTEFCTPCW